MSRQIANQLSLIREAAELDSRSEGYNAWIIECKIAVKAGYERERLMRLWIMTVSEAIKARGN